MKRRICRVRRYRGRAELRPGYTLVEVLVALAVSVAVIGTLLSAHVAALRAEARALEVEEAVRMVERAVGLAWLGNSQAAIEKEIAAAGWKARFDVAGGGTDGPAWIECGILRGNGGATVAWMQPAPVQRQDRRP